MVASTSTFISFTSRLTFPPRPWEGDWIAIASYLGGAVVFDRATANFAVTYADQNERDYDALAKAAASGT